MAVKYIYADGFQVAEIVSGTAYYPVQDYVGSNVKVTNGAGSTTYQANYYPYGRASVTSGSVGHESLRFTEMPYDVVTGLYFFGTRFYDPTIGRFVQMDTFGGVLSRPLSLNKYAYAGDNPMTFSDRSGFDWWTDAQNWWNGLSPTDRTVIIVGVAIIITVATVGVAAPLAGIGVAGEAGVEIGADLSVEGEVDAGGGLLSASLEQAAWKAGESALVNGGATLAKDLAGGESLYSASTWEDVGLHAVFGAIGGGVTYGLTTLGLAGSLPATIASNVLGGLTSSVFESVVVKSSGVHLWTDYGLDAVQGAGAGYLQKAGAGYVPSNVFDFVQDFFGGFS